MAFSDRHVVAAFPWSPRYSLLGMTAIMLGTGVGCSEIVNPWCDELPPTSAVTTTSEDLIKAMPGTPSLLQRPYAVAETHAQPGEVTHWPLYYEDPFEDRGSDDDTPFRVTAEDYLAFPYGMGRNLVNTMFFPVSAVVVPPWTVMVSDGQTSRQKFGYYDHDAEELREPVSEPLDIVEASEKEASLHQPVETANPEP